MYYFKSIVLIFVYTWHLIENSEFSEKLTDYPFLYLIVISPEQIPEQKTLRVCSTIMLVEDCSYLTSKKCFDDHTNNKVAKIAMIQQDRPSFGSLEYESYILRFKDLDNLVVLQRDGITLILDEHFNTNFGNSTNKDPYAIDELKQPRVLLTYPGNARFTHCYCLGWGSSSKTYESLETLKLKFQLSRVHSTKLTDEGKSILIELEEDEPKVDDFGSPLICEVRQGPAVLGAAVIGIYKDGDSKFSTLHNSLSVYVSFSGTLGHLTRWAIGTNVSVSGKLEEWTLWPEKPSKGAIFQEVKTEGNTICLNPFLCFMTILYFISKIIPW